MSTKNTNTRDATGDLFKMENAHSRFLPDLANRINTRSDERMTGTPTGAVLSIDGGLFRRRMASDG
jgi:hypothetical protein